MRAPLALVSLCVTFSGTTFAATKKVEQGPITIEAKMVAADRSGQKEFPKLTAKNTDPKEEFTVKGRVRLFDKSEKTLKDLHLRPAQLHRSRRPWLRAPRRRRRASRPPRPRPVLIRLDGLVRGWLAQR